MFATRVCRGAAATSLLVTIAIASACSDSKSTAPVVPSVISVVRGSGQSIIVGSAVADTLAVMVTTAGADPARGVEVTWTVVQGDGTLSSVTSTTDNFGQAIITYAAGHTAEGVTVHANVGSLDPAVFTLVQAADTPHAIAETTNEPTATVLGTGAVQLSVRIQDEFGNAVPNATVSWTVSGGDGKDSFDLGQTATDDQGIAFVQYLPADVAGARVVRAQVTQGVSVDIAISVQAATGPASIRAR